MYTQKAFAKIQSLIDNALGVISPIGELSPRGWSFSREKTHYSSADYPGVSLSVFHSERIVGVGADAVSEYVEPDPVLESRIIQIVSWIHQNAQAGRFNQNPDDFETSMIDYWGEQIDYIANGRMVGVEGSYYPTWVDFKLTDLEEESRFKVWFSDEAFVNEFDHYQNLVVPPVADLDSLIAGYAEVSAVKSTVSMVEIMDRINTTRDIYPETTIRTLTFNWTNPLNRTQKIPFDWSAIIYGLAGDNVDNVKEAIRDYIDANSENPRSVWEQYFPEIYTSTEFIVTPMFNHYSIPNRRLSTGLYSPAITVHDLIEISKLACKGEGYTEEFVARHVTSVPSVYKQLALAVTPGPNNREGSERFANVFPDYINQRSTDEEFGRMSSITRDFVIMLNTMLRHAETLSDISTVPRGYNRTIREGIVYLSQSYKDVQYLVVSKHSLNDPSTGIPNILTDGDGYILTDGETELVGS